MHKTELKKKKTGKLQGKITIYFEQDIKELYDLGNQNGWDVPETVRQAVTKVIRKNADKLRKSAKELS